MLTSPAQAFDLQLLLPAITTGNLTFRALKLQCWALKERPNILFKKQKGKVYLRKGMTYSLPSKNLWWGWTQRLSTPFVLTSSPFLSSMASAPLFRFHHLTIGSLMLLHRFCTGWCLKACITLGTWGMERSGLWLAIPEESWMLQLHHPFTRLKLQAFSLSFSLSLLPLPALPPLSRRLF